MKYSIKEKSKNAGYASFVLEIESEMIDEYRGGVIKELGKNIEIKGFRPGKAPENILEEEIGELKILEKSVQKSLEKIYPDLVNNEKINPISFPEIEITKLAPGNPVECKIKIALMPEAKLPDYKKLAKEVPKITKEEITDKQVDDYIDFIRKQRGQAIAQSKNDQDIEKHIPELNDEFVQSLGNFKNVSEFKNHLKENLQKEKDLHAEQKRRVDILEKIIKESEVTLPDILVQEELEKRWSQFVGEIERFKMKPEDYLKEIKKTEKDLKDEWRPDAEKSAKMNIILPMIAKEEKIRADENEVGKEVEHLIEHHPDVNKERATAYVAMVLTNENVIRFLENL